MAKRKRLEADVICETLDLLIDNIRPTGDIAEDTDAFLGVSLLGKIYTHLTDELLSIVTDFEGDTRASVENVRDCAKAILLTTKINIEDGIV